MLVGAPEDPEVGLGRHGVLGVLLHVDVDAAPTRVARVDEEPPALVGARVALAAIEPLEVLGGAVKRASAARFVKAYESSVGASSGKKRAKAKGR